MIYSFILTTTAATALIKVKEILPADDQPSESHLLQLRNYIIANNLKQLK